MLPFRMAAQLVLGHPRFLGANEFVFRPRPVYQSGLHAIDIKARGSDFRSRLVLRPNSSDIPTFNQVFVQTHYSLRDLARHDDIGAFYEACDHPLILDLGANIGLSTVYFASSWPKSTIVGVEPDTENYRLFKLNTEALSEIIGVRSAVASKKGAMRIANPEAESWAYRTEFVDQAAEAISAVTVPELLELQSGKQPFICKIDIEGAEEELFSANTEWMLQFPVIIIELHDWMLPHRGTSANFIRLALSIGYDFILKDQNLVCMRHKMPTPGATGAR